MRASVGPARRALVAPLVASLLLLTACGNDTGSSSAPASGGQARSDADDADDAGDADAARDTAADASGSAGAAARAQFPALRARRQVTGLALPWDVQHLPGVGLLVDERETKRLYLVRNGSRRTVAFPAEQVWAEGETGLMGLAVDPAFRKNRRFYTCHGGYVSGGGHDVRVDAWRLSDDETRAVPQQVLLRGIDARSGRHGGCRLLVASGGALLVGTGDAAVGTNPQDTTSLAGKVLRLDRFTGRPKATNPWPRARSVRRRYVYNYGHRNVQGLAQYPGGRVWSVEHGPTRDDEVNRVVKGGNYGWDPRPGYDEGVPMTDFSLPGKQIGARWRSGSPTLATSGAAFVRGRKWGAYRGALAVAALKAERLVFMKFDKRGRLMWTRAPRAPRQFGRLRSVTVAPNNDLLVTTGNGSDDAVVRVSPR